MLAYFGNIGRFPLILLRIEPPMKLTYKLLTAVVFMLSLTAQSAFATDSTSADDACYHNIIRDALNNGKTMFNLWDGVNPRSHNFATEIRPNPRLPFLNNNSSLKNSARSVASNCSWGHSGISGIGENLYWITERSGKTANEWIQARNGTVERAVNTWAYEAAFYSQANNSCSREPCGHYTQIVWDSSVATGPTTNVGCVAQFCPNGIANTSSYQSREATYVICHYQPPGNYIGVTPYAGQSTSSGSNEAASCSGSGGGSSSSDFPLSAIMLLLNG